MFNHIVAATDKVVALGCTFIFILAAAFGCYALGKRAANAISGGRLAVFFGGVLAAACSFSVAAAVTMALFNHALAAEIVGGIAATLALLPAIGALVTGAATARHMRALAPSVRIIGLKYFLRLDKDKDGVLSKPELEVAMTRKRLTKEERAVLTHILNALAEVGHRIGGESSSVFAVSKRDLESYPRRINDKYKGW